MTDLEATRLCAVAMGYEDRSVGESIGGIMAFNGVHHLLWNPLHDDAQAMALGKSDPALFATVIREWAHEMLMGRDADLNSMLVHEFAAMQQAKNSAK